jgi:citrate synthase
MRQQKPLRSEMGWSTPDKITVRGRDLCNELLGKIDLGGMAWLELTGRMPTPQEAVVFNALLVTLVEHGMTPHAIATRMVQVCAPEARILERALQRAGHHLGAAGEHAAHSADARRW